MGPNKAIGVSVNGQNENETEYLIGDKMKTTIVEERSVNGILIGKVPASF